MSNSTLNRAKANKNDEFYTRYEDIEEELCHYEGQLKGKNVYLDCDDPYESDFFRYFVTRFGELGVGSLTCTGYRPDRFDGHGIFAKVTRVDDEVPDPHEFDREYVNRLLSMKGNKIRRMDGNGDFRSEECLGVLDESDVVITNPPFSLFRDFFSSVIGHGKDFLVISNLNAVKYKEVFPFVRDGSVRLGNNRGSMRFLSRDDGWEEVTMGNACWLTTLDVEREKESGLLTLTKRYDQEEYPAYANFDGIDVGRVANIPCDYPGNMGVPVSFMNVYDPRQFEIVGYGHGSLGQEIGVSGIPAKHRRMMRGHSSSGDLYYLKDGKPWVPHARIVIRNRHPEV